MELSGGELMFVGKGIDMWSIWGEIFGPLWLQYLFLLLHVRVDERQFIDAVSRQGEGSGAADEGMSY